MEYSIFFVFLEYGIFHKLTATTEISKMLEYGIFQEYSKTKVKQPNYAKFWNMEYSMEY